MAVDRQDICELQRLKNVFGTSIWDPRPKSQVYELSCLCNEPPTVRWSSEPGDNATLFVCCVSCHISAGCSSAAIILPLTVSVSTMMDNLLGLDQIDPCITLTGICRMKNNMRKSWVISSEAYNISTPFQIH